MSSPSSSSSTFSILNRPRQSQWPTIPMDQAWSILDEQITLALDQLRRVEERGANECLDLLGAILAEPLHANGPVPAFRASIKDGYALIAADGPGPRRVIGVSTAGGSEEMALASGQCIRISTGARVPDGADAVVQVENTKVLQNDGEEELVIDIGGVAPVKGQDIRNVGSDVANGELLLAKGTKLGPAEIGLLALSGRQKFLLFGRPRVSVLSTGDELIDFPQNNENLAAAADGVIDTNRPMLLALLHSNGMEAIDCGIARDRREELVAALERAMDTADVLVLSGGVSMGEKDLLKSILVSHFRMTIHFGRVFMKPGLPTTFAAGTGPDGRTKLVFGLPGNPVSAFVTAHLFLMPQLRRIAGMDSEWHSPRIRVKLAHPIPSLDARPEYRRASLLLPRLPSSSSSSSSSSSLLASPPFAEPISGSQISSRLLSTRSANLLLELPPKSDQKEGIEEGETVTALLLLL